MDILDLCSYVSIEGEMMNILKKILEEIREVEKEYVVGHKVLFALGATGIATEISSIIRSHMVEKENVTSAEIIRNFIDGKPYYSIKFKETDKDDYTIGYSSYNLAYVIEWLNECFEFCGKAKVISDNGWIPVSEKLPETREGCLVTVRYTGFLGMYGIWVKTGHIENDGEWFGDCMGGEVIAWQPLPEPYKMKENK